MNGVLPPPPPPQTPELTISGGAGVTEGQDAVFTISASPAATSPLAVNLSVSQSGDFASSLPSTVTLTGGSATLRVGTVNDSADEADGSVTVALASGHGYTVGSSGAATVAVSDNDDAPQAGSLDCDNSGVIVDEFTMTERYNGLAFFRVMITLCEPHYGPKVIDYAIEHITTDDADLFASGGTLWMDSFVQSKHINVAVKSDGVREGDETFALVLSNPNPSFIDLGHDRVLGTISDP